MTSPADALLARLDRVRQVGPGRWIARCPAHEDRSPSLSVRELDDGRVLVYDFAGCAAADIVAAVGLTLADLYPAALADRSRPEYARRHTHAAREALLAVHRECLVVAVAAEHLHAGRTLEPEDRARLREAVETIRAAAGEVVT